VALSHHEQQVLSRIAADLYADNPTLARQLSGDIGGAGPTRWRRSYAVVAFVIGLVTMTSAIFVPHRGTVVGILAASVLAYLVMFTAALAWCGLLPRTRQAETTLDDADARPPNADHAE
jgi:hypothetical protein